MWVVLILVFSIILVPVAGEEDNTGNGTSIGLNLEQVIEESNSAGSSENAGLSPEKELEEISDTDSQETAGKDQKLTIETGSRSERRENEIKALEPKALEPGTRANNDIKSSDTAVKSRKPGK